MTNISDDIVLEASARSSKPLRYHYALAFLDGAPNPKSRQDIERLVRLMAYDIVAEKGDRGRDPAGIYAAAMRIVHVIKGGKSSSWEWRWRDLHFSASPCEMGFFAGDHCGPPDQNGDLFLLSDWRLQLDEAELPDFIKIEDAGGQFSYPDPEQAILASSLLTLEAFQQLICPQRSILWVGGSRENSVLLELWSEKTSKFNYLRR